jgi:hypothetical protein
MVKDSRAIPPQIVLETDISYTSENDISFHHLLPKSPLFDTKKQGATQRTNMMPVTAELKGAYASSLRKEINMQTTSKIT